MFTIDVTSSKTHFIIKKNGEEFTRVSKAVNTLDAVKKHFHIEIVEEAQQ